MVRPNKRFLKPIKKWLRAVIYWGNQRFCPICGRFSRKFAGAGAVPRVDAKCVHCGSVERHRLTWLYFQKRTNLLTQSELTILHIAPEPCLAERLKGAFGNGYITADLESPSVSLKMDITDIQLKDGIFDVIYCSHVLEHVGDDRKALREFRRVLKPSGWALLLVPITCAKTFEDPSVTDPTERLRIFGQEDHVRRYGPDYLDRLKEAGFVVQVIKPSDFLTASEIENMGITAAAGDLYHCAKRQSESSP
jgi:SAM-dependent methyltransferase